MSADCGVFDETPSKDSDPRPTINLFEQREEGAHMPKVANARDFAFPKSLVVPFTWLKAPNALSLSDAVNDVSQHEERERVGSSITNQAGTRNQLPKSTCTQPGLPLE